MMIKKKNSKFGRFPVFLIESQKKTLSLHVTFLCVLSHVHIIMITVTEIFGIWTGSEPELTDLKKYTVTDEIEIESVTENRIYRI